MRTRLLCSVTALGLAFGFSPMAQGQDATEEQVQPEVALPAIDLLSDVAPLAQQVSTAEKLSCNLLFPFIARGDGMYDTGIAIANVSLDPVDADFKLAGEPTPEISAIPPSPSMFASESNNALVDGQPQLFAPEELSMPAMFSTPVVSSERCQLPSVGFALIRSP